MADDGVSENNVYSNLNDYRRRRRKFSITVYSLASIFVLASFVQWIPMVLVRSVETFYLENYYLSLICLSFALLSVTIFVFFEKARFLFPLNWVLAVIIIEGATLGLAHGLVESDIWFFAAVGVFAFIVVLVFLIIGTFIPHDFTLDVLILFVLSVIFFIGLVLFVMIYILSEIPVSDVIFAGLVMIIVCVFIMYHVQIIHGYHYSEMRIKDYLLGALILYHDYLIIYIVIYYMASKHWVSTDEDFF